MRPSDERLFSEAFRALNEGRLEQAERGFKKFLRSEPRHSGALNLYGITLFKAGNYREAEPVLRQAISVDASSNLTFYNHGLVLKQLGRPLEALEAFSRSIEIKPTAPETWNSRGTVFRDLLRYAEAVADFDRAISLSPNYAEAHINRGNSLFAEENLAAAAAAYDRAIAIRSDFPHAWLGKANVLVAQAQHADTDDESAYQEALDVFGQVVKSYPELAEAWIGYGQIYTSLGKKELASAAYERALGIYRAKLKAAPDLIEGWLGCGVVYRHLRRCDEALEAYRQAHRINALLPDPLLGQGHTLNLMNRFEEATRAFDAALAINPRSVSAWSGRAWGLIGCLRLHDAERSFEQALALKSDFTDAWLGIGKIYCILQRPETAIPAIENALRISPGNAGAWFMLGETYIVGRQYAKAVAATRKCLEKPGEIDFVEGQLANCYALLCDWEPLEPVRHECIADVRAGLPTTPPFASLVLGMAAAEQLACARKFTEITFPPPDAPVKRRPRDSDGRIRIAYLSADFQEHPVAYLASAVFEHHDRNNFETIALAVKPDDGSAARSRLVKAFDQFHDVSATSNRDVAQMVADIGCDIFVDLTGYTYGNRTPILAFRPAPVQVNWLGYAGTMGADFIDYIIADDIVIPTDMQRFFTEKVVTLPGCYLPNDRLRPIASTAYTRAEQGLPETGFIFACFNNAQKLTAEIFDRWMNLLRRVDHSVLWLSAMNDIASNNLRREAEQRGVSSERLVFARHMDRHEDHLARLALADLFLDTPGYNAHASACDALWAGLPVLTCIGETFAGRVAASALTAAGLPELITSSLDDYELLALKLAHEPERLTALKLKLASNRLSCPLFDTARFTRQLEAAYLTMHERALHGQPPVAFTVSAE